MTETAIRIALLRGINVGGHRKLPMAELRELMAGIGFEAPRTYIQSGNLVFRTRIRDNDTLAQALGDAIEARYGFRPETLVFEPETFDGIAAANPYPVPSEAGNTVHVWFLAEPCERPDTERMTALAADSEAWSLTDRALYLHAPDGIGRSKLAEKIEACVPVRMTARNLRTVRAIQALVAEAG